MAVITNFQSFMATGGLVCPPEKSKIEYAVADELGLFAECRSSAKSVPTWYLRLKNAKGTNVYKKLGTVKDVSLAQARKLVKQVRAEHIVAVKAAAAPVSVVAAQEMTLERFVQDLYYPHARIHKRSFKKDETLYRLRIGPKFGHLPLSAINLRDVQKFHNELLSENLSAASCNHHVVLMRRFCSLAVSWELLDRNVLKGVALMPLDNFRDTFLTPEQTARLVEVLTTDTNKPVSALLLFLLNTGGRKMEAAKAKWVDIDLANRLWHVPAVNNKSKRPKTVPLNDSALQVLTQLDSRGKCEYVFPNPETGLPYTTITRVWWRIRRDAGIDSTMRIHDFRACLSERLLSGGASIYTLQKLLGHQDIRTTATRYARLSAKSLLDAANIGSVPMPQPQAQAA